MVMHVRFFIFSRVAPLNHSTPKNVGVYLFCRYMLGIAAIPAVIQFVGFLLMPESPRWPFSHGKYVTYHQIYFTITKLMSSLSLSLFVLFSLSLDI